MICYWTQVLLGLLQWLSSKELACQYRRCRCNPWMGKILWRRTWQLQCSCLENPMDRGAWWATVHGVAEEFGQNLVTYKHLLFNISTLYVGCDRLRMSGTKTGTLGGVWALKSPPPVFLPEKWFPCITFQYLMSVVQARDRAFTSELPSSICKWTFPSPVAQSSELRWPQCVLAVCILSLWGVLIPTGWPPAYSQCLWGWCQLPVW